MTPRGSDSPARYNWLLGLWAQIRSPVGEGWARLLLPDSFRLWAQPIRPAAELLGRRRLLDSAQVTVYSGSQIAHYRTLTPLPPWPSRRRLALRSPL